MKILMVCAELAPWAKTGGLADAVAGLSAALAANGHDVEVLLPAYSHLPTPPTDPIAIDSAVGPLTIRELPATADESNPTRRQPRVRLVDLGELTADRIYTGDDRDAGRFLRLAAAAAALSVGDAQPDVVHCHDWHSALTPALQRRQPGQRRAPSVLTLHNVGYQGVFPDAVLADYGTEELAALIPQDALSGGTVNFLRAGLLFANQITTVSPTYASEILRPEYGMGLEDTLGARHEDLVGILNGVDYGVWSPQSDPFIAEPFGPDNLAAKERIKRGLATRLGLQADDGAALIGVVTRLAAQKGIDLLTAVLPTLLTETSACFALLGSGEAPIAADLTRIAAAHPQRLSFTDGYDDGLSHQIFAGSDLTLVPSRYEPCGLTQMYALRYGTIPVVRATGGLADTIQHFDPATGSGNGSVFRDADPPGLLWGIRTALSWYARPKTWSRLVANAMAADFSWHKQVTHYEALYRWLA